MFLGSVWVAQSVERRTLDLGPGHHLTVTWAQLCIGFGTDTEPALDSVSPLYSSPACVLSLKINKLI